MVNSKSSVFLFIGSDVFSKDKAIKDLTSSILDGSSKDLDYRVFYGGEATTGQILEYLATAPFLASKRIAVVKNFEKLPSEFKTRLASYLKNPSKSTCLILDTAESSMPEGYNSMIDHLSVQKFGELSSQGLISWVKKFLANLEKTIEEDAVRDLEELTGKNLLLLKQELEKLAAFVGERNEIKANDVAEVVGKSLMASAFDLAWSVGKKDIDTSLGIISDSILSGRRPQEIIGLLCWHFKRIVKAKSLQKNGASEYAIACDLKINRKDQDEFFGQANAFEIKRLKAMMSILLEADLDLKRTKYDPYLVLEFAVIRLCLL